MPHQYDYDIKQYGRMKIKLKKGINHYYRAVEGETFFETMGNAYKHIKKLSQLKQFKGKSNYYIAKRCFKNENNELKVIFELLPDSIHMANAYKNFYKANKAWGKFSSYGVVRYKVNIIKEDILI